MTIQQRMRPLIWLLVTMTAACGSIAGNPKKPGGGDKPPTATVYQLPLIDFVMPDDATSDDPSGLLLAPSFDQNKGLLTFWGRRVDRVINRVNAISERVNKIITKAREDGDAEDVVRFAGRGEDNKLAGRVGPAAATSVSEGFAYEAVLCHAGTPFAWLLWSEDGKKMRLTRDFNRSDREGEAFKLLSRIDVTAGDSTVLDILNQGTEGSDASAMPNAEGEGITERTQAVKAANGDIELKATSDRYAQLPADGVFEGDAYITGRLYKTEAVNDAGLPEFDTEFVGFFKGFKILCKAGFDEQADDVWSPDTEGPRFCVGRPKGAKRFTSFDQFVETTAALEPVGIVPASQLEVLALPDDLSCD